MGIEGNEAADEWAKMAAESTEAVASEYLRETSFAHMREASAARAEGIARCMVSAT